MADGLRLGLKMTDEEILAQNKEQRQECEIYTRVMGYFRPLSHFNKGKVSEYEDRVWFTENKACCFHEQKDVA